MHIIARPALRGFADIHPDAKEWLENWWLVASRARWESLQDVRDQYASADRLEKCLIFDRGNKYRLIVRVSFARGSSQGTLLVKHFLTHAEYSKNRWKDCCR